MIEKLEFVEFEVGVLPSRTTRTCHHLLMSSFERTHTRTHTHTHTHTHTCIHHSRRHNNNNNIIIITHACMHAYTHIHLHTHTKQSAAWPMYCIVFVSNAGGICMCMVVLTPTCANLMMCTCHTTCTIACAGQERHRADFQQALEERLRTAQSNCRVRSPHSRQFSCMHHCFYFLVSPRTAAT